MHERLLSDLVLWRVQVLCDSNAHVLLLFSLLLLLLAANVKEDDEDDESEQTPSHDANDSPGAQA